MTLKEMAAEYRANAAIMQERILSLKAQLRCCADRQAQQLLDWRIQLLTQLCRESRANARIMDTYYEVRRERHVSTKACALFELSKQ